MSEVTKTLFEAVVLVVLVIFVFLQNWRAMLIPAIAIPVVLLGTFAIFYVAGFTINTLTLFGLTLAVGLLVDDAIVVVENVERLLDENPGMSPRDATIQSMGEIQVALVAIALSLSAVFLPMAFFGGSTGVIYQQFSLTIVSAMILSVLVALILSPALTSTLLRQKVHGEAQPGALDRRFPAVARPVRSAQAWFNRTFANLVARYREAIVRVIDRKWLFLAIYGVIFAILILLFARLPTGFLPTEDQGAASLQFRLPPGATQVRTLEVRDQIEQYFADHEPNNIQTLFTVAGGGGGGGAVGQNTGQGFINFVHWDERTGKENSADAIVQRASSAFRNLRDAQVFALVPGAIRGLGQSQGFTMELQNRSGMSREAFLAARDRLLAAANDDPQLDSVRLSDLPDVSTLKIDIDQQKLTALGLDQGDVNSTLSTAWGGRYVNDFIDLGRVKRVQVQGDAPYRSDPRKPVAMVCPLVQRRDGAILVICEDRLGDRPEQPVPVPGRARVRIPGPTGAGRQLRPGDEPRSRRSLRKFPARASPGPGSPSRSGFRPARRRFSTACPCWSCSSAWQRFMKAGRSRSRCCSSSRWAWSAPSSR